MLIDFEITTPSKTIFKDKIDSAIIPTKDGEITVLPNHIPLISIIVPAGELKLKKGSDEFSIMISGGFLEVQKENKIIILADTAERAEEIDEIRAEEARKKAEKLLEEKREDVEIADVKAILAQSLMRLKIAKKHQTKKKRF
ncbi:ATP synthase F1 subunit epsilon [Candidatus Kuenenbacteria bacterium HGW-Kuenenbacteria-1]|uniref:ATP synthase epsilon chain n=1 Tax=Candidatus Kuenenbacteria bacterium HGW-Kuenenbacteria-1 TaxID=2013812 RepID=A0A2N1UNQ4_9BACT|nr:MAG: ATP synthase F1 subunit epsilon [Candidatus Kuenenbacteria bacterium HGW-Kuenenbacteria-1]